MCHLQCLKIMMFIFSSSMFLAAAAILGVGIWLAVDITPMFGVLVPYVYELINVGYLFITLGAILALVCFLGCYGAKTENKCILLTVQGIVAQQTEGYALEIWIYYGRDEFLTSFLNDIMERLKCCGFVDYTDFTGSPFVTNTNTYPETCCGHTSVCNETEAEKEMVIGCYMALVQLTDNISHVIGGVALSMAALEIAAMVVSMVLFNKIIINNYNR